MDFDAFVLAASTATLGEEPTARSVADAIEFRMDLAATPLDDLREYGGRLPVIATNRLESEGGKAPPGEERLGALEAAAALPHVAAIDVELDVAGGDEGARLIDAARGEGAAVIVSLHDFEGTPSHDRLRDRLARAADVGDVGKVAVTATDVGDVLDLLAVTLDRSRDGDVVATMAMGDPGRHSRAVAPLYGSRIGYAPIDPEAATAPGQYDVATLRSLVDRLGV